MYLYTLAKWIERFQNGVVVGEYWELIEYGRGAVKGPSLYKGFTERELSEVVIWVQYDEWTGPSGPTTTTEIEEPFIRRASPRLLILMRSQMFILSS